VACEGLCLFTITFIVSEQFLNRTSALQRPFGAIHDNSSVATVSEYQAPGDLQSRLKGLFFEEDDICRPRALSQALTQ